MGSVVLHKKASRWGAFFVFALWAGAAQALCPLPEAGEPIRVERVVDGDTVRLAGGRRVRLIGINAPELGGQGRAGEPYAQAARRALEVRVRESGDTLRLVPGLERRDAHGRELAHLYDRDGRNLAALLLEDGLAFQVAVAPNLRLVDCHRQLERRARVARRGLWERDPYLAPGQLTRPGFALVRGRVARVERNRGGVWLELDGDLALRIEPRHLPAFQGVDLAALAGREVEARGWVVERRQRARGRARWLLGLEDSRLLGTGM